MSKNKKFQDAVNRAYTTSRIKPTAQDTKITEEEKKNNRPDILTESVNKLINEDVDNISNANEIHKAIDVINTALLDGFFGEEEENIDDALTTILLTVERIEKG